MPLRSSCIVIAFFASYTVYAEPAATDPLTLGHDIFGAAPARRRIARRRADLEASQRPVRCLRDKRRLGGKRRLRGGRRLTLRNSTRHHAGRGLSNHCAPTRSRRARRAKGRTSFDGRGRQHVHLHRQRLRVSALVQGESQTVAYQVAALRRRSSHEGAIRLQRERHRVLPIAQHARRVARERLAIRAGQSTCMGASSSRSFPARRSTK